MTCRVSVRRSRDQIQRSQEIPGSNNSKDGSAENISACHIPKFSSAGVAGEGGGGDGCQDRQVDVASIDKFEKYVIFRINSSQGVALWVIYTSSNQAKSL